MILPTLINIRTIVNTNDWVENFFYESRHHEDFVNLSIEWLKKHDLYEDTDKPILENPLENSKDLYNLIY